MEQVVITGENPQAPEGHDAKMIALADSKLNPQEEVPTTAERPAWLPEKFKSAEDMAKAYSELESKLGQPKEPETSQENPPVETPSDDKVKEALESKALDVNEFSKEFSEKGTLSDESYKKLADAGFGKDIVDQFIAGRQAVSQQYEDSVTAEVGGKESYAEMVAWAKANLKDAEIQSFNEAVSSGDINKAKLAVLGLGSKFAKEVGEVPTLVGGRTTAGTADVFESNAQVTAAMKDPRYRTDPAFRKSVSDKISRSPNVL